MAQLSLLFALVLACISFPGICCVGDNDKDENAKKKTEVCVRDVLRESIERQLARGLEVPL